MQVGVDDRLFERAKAVEPKTVLNMLGIQTDKQGRFCCPVHDDQNPSADFKQKGSGGKWGPLWHCFGCNAGGSVIDLVKHVRSVSEVEAARWILNEQEPQTGGTEKPANEPPGLKVVSVDGKPEKAKSKPYETLDAAVKSIKPVGLDHGKLYRYDDCHYVLRLEPAAAGARKEFRPIHHADDGKWYVQSGGSLWPLYGTDGHDFDDSSIVVIVEGEKAADSINAAYGRFRAVTSQGGAKRANGTDWQGLPDGVPVMVWPDNDEQGQKYASDVIDLMTDAGRWPDAGVRMVDASKWPHKYDAADVLQESWPAKKKLESLEIIYRDLCTDFPTPEQRRQEQAESELAGLGFLNGDEIEVEPIQYIMPGVMARGELSLIIGAAGSGKTKVAIARAAKLTNGEPIDGVPVRNGPHKVAIISFEECPKRAIKPVCMHSGMNMKMVKIWEQPDGKAGIGSLNDLETYLTALARAGASYVLIDSLTALYSRLGVDSNDQNGPYKVHGLINRVARACNICIEMIHHYGKAAGVAHADHQKSAGSFAVVSSVRSVIQVEYDPTTGSRFIGASPGKNNMGLKTACLGFRTTRVREDLNDGQGYIIAELHGWNTDETIEDVSARITRAKNDDLRAKIKPVSVQVAEQIQEFLAVTGGVRTVEEVETHLAKSKFSSNAIKAGKQGFGKFKAGVGGKWYIHLTNLSENEARSRVTS